MFLYRPTVMGMGAGILQQAFVFPSDILSKTQSLDTVHRAAESTADDRLLILI